MLHPSARGAALSAALAVLCHGPLRAQDPAAQDPAGNESKPQPAPTETAESAEAPAAPVLALRVGTVHTVDGETIQDGRILMQGDKILAVGSAESVALPEGAQEWAYPEGHAYPGLVDAMSDAFAPGSEVENKGWDAGTDMADGLDPFQTESQKLVQYGITTAYVQNRSEGQWRGIGALLRLTADGFTHSDLGSDAVALRLTAGPQDAHPLARAGALKAADGAFKALEGYKKALEEHEKALKKYDEDFEKWLAHYRGEEKKEGEAAGEGAGEAPASGEGAGPRGPGGNAGRRRGRRGPGGGDPAGGGGGGNGPRGGGGGEFAVAEPIGAATSGTLLQPQPQDPQPQDPQPRRRGRGGAPAGNGGGEQPQGGGEEKKEGEDDKAPKRPDYPKPVERDPAKDALLEVVDGKRPLRIEAHRIDEIRAALELGREFGVGRIVLEHASAGDRIADEIARAGVPVIVTELLPGSVPETYGEVGDDEMAEGALPARLHAEGVSVAIASGGARKARFLPMAAAWAAGQGLPHDVALRAITLTPAEILGVGAQLGSLTAGKLADVLVTSGPLFDSGSRVLRVVAGGTTAYEAPAR